MKIKKYSPDKNPIKIKCEARLSVPLEDLIIFQGGLKTLSEENRDRLACSILEQGFCAPVFIWDTGEGKKLLDSKQRASTLNYLKENGWYVPDIPAAIVKADTEQEARDKILAISSQYGEFSRELLSEWLEDSDSDSYRLLSSEGELYYDDGNITTTPEEDDNLSVPEKDKIEAYSRVIKAPIYEPQSEEPPELSELVDVSKTVSLIKEIKAANIPEDVKTFLKSAAQRHLVFNYEKVAEYYAHAPIEVQDLMEKSALVIIDYKKAVENGFVKMCQELKDLYLDEKE